MLTNNLPSRLECSHCGEKKKPEQFYNCSASKTGKQSRCIACEKEYAKAEAARMTPEAMLQQMGNRLWRVTSG